MTRPLLADLTADLLRERIDAVRATEVRPGPQCGVAMALEKVQEVDAESADVLRVAFDDDTLPASRLEQLAHELGIDVSAWSIQRHRRGVKGLAGRQGCKCPTTT